MIDIKTTKEIEIMAEGGKLLASILSYLHKMTKPGLRVDELNKKALELAEQNNAVPSFYNYRGYPANVCVSLNDEVVHGIPLDQVIKKGDVVSLDLGLKYKGLFTDSAITFAVGLVDKKVEELIKITERSLYTAIDQVKPGNRVGDIGAAIEEVIKPTGFSIVRDLTGHGVGRAVHEEPQIPNFNQKGIGPVLKEGMVIAIEPMINMGGYQVKMMEDGWTFKTFDGQVSAHFEHTVAVTKDGYKILTSL